MDKSEGSDCGEVQLRVVSCPSDNINGVIKTALMRSTYNANVGLFN